MGEKGLSLLVVGFDSAWTDNPRAPGALAAALVVAGKVTKEWAAALTTFDEAADWVQALSKEADKVLLAIDQPLVVPNETGSRAVEKVAAAVVSWIGGGVQPSNRSRVDMFGDGAPIWRFLTRLGAMTDPAKARHSSTGVHAIEVFPALAMPSLDPHFCGRKRHPKYNPANRKKFRLEDWQAVSNMVRTRLAERNSMALAAQAEFLSSFEKPGKSDQDKLDALICVVIGLWFGQGQDSHVLTIGDELAGFIVTPATPIIEERLKSACLARGVRFWSSRDEV